MFCTNCGAQNDDGVFNGAYLKSIPVVGPDGITYNLPVKWLPEEVDRMNPAQLVQVLTEIQSFAHEWMSLIRNKVILEDECNQLESDNVKPIDKMCGKLFLACVILSLLSLIVSFFVFYWDAFSYWDALWDGLLGAIFFTLILFCFLLWLGFLIYFIPEVWGRSKRKKAYKNRYGAACKELDEANRLVDDYKAKNSLIIRSAYTVLPDYCCNESALVHMIASLRNHRAASLGEALNLFVTEKNIREQNQLIQEQIRVGKLAAENASRAADAARSAASAANYAAASANRHP